MTETMRPDSLTLLKKIGDDLDRQRTLRVRRGGTVWPGDVRLSQDTLGSSEEVIAHGTEHEGPSGAGGPAAGSWQGPAGRGAAGSRPSRTAASLIRVAGLTPDAEKDLVEATEEYPQLVPRIASSIVWLEGLVRPVARLQAARLIMSYPRDRLIPVRAWAWWEDGLWIGPRHVNFVEGTICAYEPGDGVWDRSKPLVRLLDLYAVWIARHLYLRTFDRWPGPQIMHTAHERLTENKPEELCAGCTSGLRYGECCRPKDLARDPKDVLREFLQRCPSPLRKAPASQQEMEEMALLRPISNNFAAAARAMMNRGPLLNLG